MTRKPLPLVAVTTVALTLSLTARGETPAAFGRRCIPAGCVAPRSNTPGILARRALPAGRIAALGATPDFHHGLRDAALRDPESDYGRSAAANWSSSSSLRSETAQKAMPLRVQ